MPEYCLILRPTTFDIVSSADDENTNIISFDRPCKIAFFKRRNYIGHVSVIVLSNVLHPSKNVLNIGDGRNLIQRTFLPPEWRQKIKPVTGIRYRLASEDHNTVFGKI